MTVFIRDEVRAMLAAAMATPRDKGRVRPPSPAQLKQLTETTNWLVEGFSSTRELREAIAACDAAASALSALRKYHEHLAGHGVDLTKIESALGSYIDRVYEIDPIWVDREGAMAQIDDCGLGEIALLAESLALACRTAFTPRDGLGAPSLKSNSAATRYAGIVIGKLTGEELTGGAVKLHHYRIEKWRGEPEQLAMVEKWRRDIEKWEASGTKA